MSVNKVDVSIYTAWKDGNLLFKNASFENIIKKLERKFNVIIDNKYNFLDQQIYTASFLDNESIEDILEYFSEETSFNYTKENNKITIITNLTN
jgi:translation elongation factor P/translation initiation factor 5A